jgi:putative MATE family efflux protein
LESIRPRKPAEAPGTTRALAGQIGRLAWPVAAGRMFQALAGFVDIAMVGSLGAAATAAVGVGRQIVFISEITMLGVIVGAQSLTARAIGQHDRVLASQVTRQALVMGAGVSAAFGLAGALASETLLRLVGAEGQVLALGTAYTRVFFTGIFANVLSHIIINTLQAAGDTTVAFYIVGAINVLHIGLGYALIYGLGPVPALGVAGAAWGMVGSRLIGWFIGLAVLASARWRVAFLPGTSFRPDWDLMGRITRLGLPVALQGLARSGASLVFLRVLATAPLATQALAAFAIGTRLEHLSLFVASAFSVAALSLVGQSLGARQPEQARRRGWLAAGLSMLALSALGLVYIIFAGPLVGLFTDDPGVRASGAVLVRVLGLSQPFLALGQVMSGALQGAGDTRSPFYFVALTQWLLYLPLGFVLTGPAGLGSTGAWWAIGLTSAAQALLLAWGFWRGRWQDERI